MIIRSIVVRLNTLIRYVEMKSPLKKSFYKAQINFYVIYFYTSVIVPHLLCLEQTIVLITKKKGEKV